MGGRDDGTERRADGARLTRRGLAALGLGLGAVLAGCADDGIDGLPGGADAPPPPEATKLPGSDVMSPTRIAYGDDPSQWGDLYRPARGSDPGSTPDGAPSKGVVVVVHGGFWKAEYDASLGAPLALSLAENGWTALNLEYRRVGPGTGGGGGYPATFDDVAAGIDLLADVEELTDAERATVVTLGHSAGGHLAVWAAARGRFERWSPVRVPVTAAVSQAGVLDLTAGLADANAAPNVRALMGGDAEADPAAYDAADPARHLPLGVPVRCVHGNADTIVPLSQSRDYVAAATAVGDDATLTEVDGDHFIVIDPATEAWERTLELLESLRA